jgi:hypothetical protein
MVIGMWPGRLVGFDRHSRPGPTKPTHGRDRQRRWHPESGMNLKPARPPSSDQPWRVRESRDQVDSPFPATPDEDRPNRGSDPPALPVCPTLGIIRAGHSGWPLVLRERLEASRFPASRALRRPGPPGAATPADIRRREIRRSGSPGTYRGRHRAGREAPHPASKTDRNCLHQKLQPVHTAFTWTGAGGPAGGSKSDISLLLKSI